MKQSKKDISLNEKDALQDMLNAEKQLVNLYTVALLEGSSKSLRKEFLHNCSATADDQFSVFEQMLARGYYTPAPAEKQMIEEKTQQFSKVLKQIS